MDYLRKYDIVLEKDEYYAGERIQGSVLIESIENIKVKGVRITLRGKAHVEWKITRNGERRTVKEDQYILDEKQTVWGIDKSEPDSSAPILPRGRHNFNFLFQLPETALPCSFESKIGNIRYYLRVVIDIPYASTPQGIRYFTIIGPHTDCMDEGYLAPYSVEDRSTKCCLCPRQGVLVLHATLDRSAYCCGERIKLKSEVQNGTNKDIYIICRLVQYVEYFINKGVLGLTKELRRTVLEYRSPPVEPHNVVSFDNLQEHILVPIMPPTLIDICKCIQIYYVLEVSLGMNGTTEELEINFPITVATVPFRIPNRPWSAIKYENATEHVEGGNYVSPEFQMGQVYDGHTDENEEIILYKPVYVFVSNNMLDTQETTPSSTSRNPYKKQLTSQGPGTDSKMKLSENESSKLSFEKEIQKVKYIDASENEDLCDVP